MIYYIRLGLNSALTACSPSLLVILIADCGLCASIHVAQCCRFRQEGCQPVRPNHPHSQPELFCKQERIPVRCSSEAFHLPIRNCEPRREWTYIPDVRCAEKLVADNYRCLCDTMQWQPANNGHGHSPHESCQASACIRGELPGSFLATWPASQM